MVCEFYDVPYEKLLQKTRKREIVQARPITMYLAKAFTKNSLNSIGETILVVVIILQLSILAKQ